MRVVKEIKREGQTFRIIQISSGTFRIIDDTESVLDEFHLARTVDGWQAFRKRASHPSVATFAASFAAEVDRGDIQIG
jgi:hypothetical protein